MDVNALEYHCIIHVRLLVEFECCATVPADVIALNDEEPTNDSISLANRE